MILSYGKRLNRSEKWKKIGKNNSRVPIVAGAAASHCRIKTAGCYPSRIISRYARTAKLRKKNGRITRICPNR
jgi:hypothetical protein